MHPPPPEAPTQQGAFGTPEEFARTVVVHGTIGWDDEGQHYELGGDDNEGVTLVKVTLFEGRGPSVPVKKGTAQGHQIKCRLRGDGFWRIPKRGEQCFVAFPDGISTIDGMGVIIACPGKNPSVQFKADRAVLDFGDDTDVIIKGRSVVLSDYENRYFAVGPTTGIKCGDKDANGFCLKGGQWLMYTTQDGNARATLKLGSGEATLVLNDGKVAGVKISDGSVSVLGTTFHAAVAVGYLGKAASALTGVAYSAAGPANVISTSWFVSPN